MPQKPAKFGIKIWMLYDATTYYVFRVFPVLRKRSGRWAWETRSILSLMQAYKKFKLNVITDNFFSSALARKLLESNSTIIDTIWSHNHEIPFDFSLKKIRHCIPQNSF